jgi:hypothetical protein
MGGNLTNHAENRVQDALWRGQALGAPATVYWALIKASRGYSSAVRGLAVLSGDTVIPTTPNGRMYRCTTAGTAGSGEPAWNGTDGGTTTDGSVIWTEMTPDFEANTNLTEVAGGAYARAPLAGSLANWSGTQGPGTTTASSGTGGQISNNVAINFPDCIGADWGVCAFLVAYDAATSGIAWAYGPMTTPRTIVDADPGPTFLAGNLPITAS